MKIDHISYCKDIEYEDLRSYTRRLFEDNKDKKTHITKLNNELKQLNNIKTSLETELETLKE